MENKNVFAQQLRELGEASKYKEQAAFFMEVTRSTLEVIETVPQKAPLWAKDDNYRHGINYSVMLKNPRGSFTFDFWGSIHDAEMLETAKQAIKRGNHSREWETVRAYLDKLGVATFSPFATNRDTGEKKLIAEVRKAIEPSAYDILAALHPISSDTFEDFCAEFGYDTDSRRAEITYRACVEQDNHMRKLYTHDELDALQEIA